MILTEELSRLTYTQHPADCRARSQPPVKKALFSRGLASRQREGQLPLQSSERLESGGSTLAGSAGANTAAFLRLADTEATINYQCIWPS